jgi:hypothetical protein
MAQTTRLASFEPIFVGACDTYSPRTSAAAAIAAAAEFRDVGGGRFGRYTRRRGSGPSLGSLRLVVCWVKKKEKDITCSHGSYRKVKNCRLRVP